MDKEREVNARKLHEATAGANQSVNQAAHAMIGESRNAAALAPRSAAAADTDQVRESRAAKVFDRQLAEELREARASASASAAEAAATREQAEAFYRQHMENQVELAKREKKKQDKALLPLV